MAEVASRSRPATLAGASLWSVLSYKPWRLSCAIDHVRVEDVPPDFFQVGNRGDCSTPRRRIVKIGLGAPGCSPLIAVPHIFGVSDCRTLKNILGCLFLFGNTVKTQVSRVCVQRAGFRSAPSTLSLKSSEAVGHIDFFCEDFCAEVKTLVDAACLAMGSALCSECGTG